MPDDEWIIVPNWDKFQHYTDRNPPWIKVYITLLNKPEFVDLTLAERGLLLGVWLLYAAADGQLRRRSVPGLYSAHTLSVHWKRLNDAGFIEFSASKPLALARARPETETETDLLKGSKGQNSAARIAAMIDNGVLADPGLLDLELLASAVPTETADELRARLADNRASS